MHLLNIFADGLWWIALFPVLLAIWFLYQAGKAAKSNSTTQKGTGGPGSYVEQNTGDVPFYKVNQFWFGVASIIAAIVVYYLIKSEA